MVQLVTEQQKTDFENDGIVKLTNAIDDKLLAKLIECFEWSIANPGPIAVGKPEGENIHFVDNGNPKAYKMYGELVLESNFGSLQQSYGTQNTLVFLPRRSS